MKKVAIGLVVTLLLVSCIGIGSVSAVTYYDKPMVVGFDELEGGDAGSSLSGAFKASTLPEVIWDPNWYYWDWYQDPYTPHSPETRISSLKYGGWIDFSALPQDVNFVGAWISGYNLTEVHFEGYNDGVLVGTSITLTPSATPTFLAANFGVPVDKVVVVSTQFNFFCMDDVEYVEQVMMVTEDIRPGVTPNNFVRNSKDPLPVAICGEPGFDAGTIAPETVILEGISPTSSWTLADVCSPGGGGPDGSPDLVLQYDSKAITSLDAIRHAAKGDSVPLSITGRLTDGTKLEGTDSVVISDTTTTTSVKKTTTPRISTKLQ
ncbi:MAG TPA: hypothetical protein PLN32_07495 [Methanoregulaceae archaeon]|nr:hypothetical protein [Methanoregulaceae archaeon]